MKTLLAAFKKIGTGGNQQTRNPAAAALIDFKAAVEADMKAKQEMGAEYDAVPINAAREKLGSYLTSLQGAENKPDVVRHMVALIEKDVIDKSLAQNVSSTSAAR